jgi:hypothetical protein
MRVASFALALGVVLSLPARSEAALIPTEWLIPTAVIDFNSTPTGSFSTLIVGDFTFAWAGFADQQHVGAIVPGNHALMDADNSNGYGASVIMSLTSGGPFTVTQFDIVTVGDPNALFHDRVDVGGVGYTSAGTKLRNDLVGITSLVINIVDLEFAVDNVHVFYERTVTETTAVPEPATLTLVGLGALGTAYRLRRRWTLRRGRVVREVQLSNTRAPARM